MANQMTQDNEILGQARQEQEQGYKMSSSHLKALVELQTPNMLVTEEMNEVVDVDLHKQRNHYDSRPSESVTDVLGEKQPSAKSVTGVLTKLAQKVSHSPGCNTQAQIHGEPTTSFTNPDICQFVKMLDSSANSQNMDIVDEKNECLNNLVSVETEPRSELKKAASIFQINADKLSESESCLPSLKYETATKSHERQPDWIDRATKIIIGLNCFLCLVTVTITVALAMLGGGNKEEKQLPQGTCVQCSKLLSNPTHSVEADPLLNKLTKHQDNGLQMCCAQDEGQMSTMWEVAARKQKALQAPRPNEMGTNLTYFPVSIKKQFQPVEDSELNMTEPSLSLDPQYFGLRFRQDYHDPLTEHVRGVKVLDSAIEINYTGLYYVYMNIFIHVKSMKPPKSLLFQNWYQYVHHIRPEDPDNSGTILLQTTHTTLMENINDQETAFAGGTFYLKKGDLIQVCIND